MALQKSFTDPDTGASFPSAYHRVDCLEVDTLHGVAQVRVSVYADAASRAAGKSPVSAGDYAIADHPAVPGVTREEPVEGSPGRFNVVEVVPAIPERRHFTMYLGLPGDDGKGLLSASRTQVYRFLKAERPEFAGALDV